MLAIERSYLTFPVHNCTLLYHSSPLLKHVVSVDITLSVCFLQTYCCVLYDFGSATLSVWHIAIEVNLRTKNLIQLYRS